VKLVLTTGDLPLFEERYGQATAADSVSQLRQQLSQLYTTFLFSCSRKCFSVREIISREVWEQVNAFYLMVKEAAQDRLFSNCMTSSLKSK